MPVEKKFIMEGLEKYRLNEFLAKSLMTAGYGGAELNRTPLGMQIIVYVEKPGLVIGRGGEKIRKTTEEIRKKFNLDNPQIEVVESENARLNPLIMANRLANLLERGWYFRRAGHNILREIMNAGALGCEIVLAGKLTGPRARTEKFVKGYMIHAGEPVNDIVKRGYTIAKKKLGVIGVNVRIILPSARLPDKFEVKEKEEVTVAVKDKEEATVAVKDKEEATVAVKDKEEATVAVKDKEEATEG
ncbi:MAG: 30S ribosomal protein S3 [Candidatus Methanolliviera sp. GoM_asphalt]|nr:MAG: 30S ribosomal protein S3 [Candidatus Methanolliviera sp. GoM_asphalt]